MNNSGDESGASADEKGVFQDLSSSCRLNDHPEDYMANTQTLIAEVYSAFNQRKAVNVTAVEVEKGLVAAGIPQFAATTVRELDEAAVSAGVEHIVYTSRKRLTATKRLSRLR